MTLMSRVTLRSVSCIGGMSGARLYPGVAAGGYWRLAAVSASLAPPSAA